MNAIRLTPETVAARKEAERLRSEKTMEDVKADRRAERKAREWLFLTKGGGRHGDH